MEILLFLLAMVPLAGMWATYKLWKWYNFYGTRFLWGLFLASFASDAAAVPISILAIRRLALGPEAPTLPGTGEILSISLIILESVFLYLVFRWRDLDGDMKRIRRGREDVSESTNLPPVEERDVEE